MISVTFVTEVSRVLGIMRSIYCRYLYLLRMFLNMLSLRTQGWQWAGVLVILLGAALLGAPAAAAPSVGGPADSSQIAGEIVFSSGPVLLNGASVGKGTKVLEGAQLQTGSGGTLYLKTVDNGFLVLRQNSRATVASYRIHSSKPAASQVKIELDYGVARHISGEGVRQSPQNFRFNTPVAAIGVRGTDFTVFADAQVMRVNVSSGGIVVGVFGGACSAGGSGPCEGAVSRELFSGDANLLLQVRRGDALPELLRSLELRPDAVAPPRADEPTENRAGQNRRSDTPASGAGNAGKGSPTLRPGLDGTDFIEVGTLRVLTPMAPEPVIVGRQLVWGRWQAVADAPADTAKLELIRNGYLPAALVDAYFITRSIHDPFVMPSEGRFAFRMTAGEAFIVDSKNLATAAAIQNPQLEIDFAKRQFATSLQVVQGSTSIDVRAQGDVTLEGELLSDTIRSNTVVRGLLGGTAAQQATYIFSRQIDAGGRAIGGTSWTR